MTKFKRVTKYLPLIMELILTTSCIFRHPEFQLQSFESCEGMLVLDTMGQCPGVSPHFLIHQHQLQLHNNTNSTARHINR